MCPVIDVDDEVMECLRDEAEPFVETTPNAVLRRVLGISGNGSGPASAAPSPTARGSDGRGQAARKHERHSKGRAKKAKGSRAPRGVLLPETEYEMPILRYLEAHGGRAPSREVVEAVGEALAERLTVVDRETLSSGDVRWKNRAAFARLRMVEDGWLDGAAPRGTWAISDKGRKRVADDQ